jgi:tRNA A37 methylthiotransferase MiaB
VSSSQEIPRETGRTVSLVTLGCARNEVDSEELAARLEAAGWELTEGPDPDVVLVNTCGFIQAAKQESIDELLAASAGGAKVVAAGCLAERYGSGLADALPEAQILGFDDYGEIAARLDDVRAGKKWTHTSRGTAGACCRSRRSAGQPPGPRTCLVTAPWPRLAAPAPWPRLAARAR